MEYRAVSKKDKPVDLDLLINQSYLNIDFIPDDFQKISFYEIERGNSILVSAHTGCGKTLIAEYAIQKALDNNKKVLYLSPIKSLSNQKYYEFNKKYSTGILTGDVKVNLDSPVLILTTEILRNSLLTGNEILKDVQYVIFDEVHYINDIERGSVWEETFLLLPNEIHLILLSATFPNKVEFANWLSVIKEKNISIIETEKRVIPLEYYIFDSNKLLQVDQMRQIKKRDVDLLKLALFVKNEKLDPAIFFTLSRQNCFKFAKKITARNFLRGDEERKVMEIIENIFSSIDIDFNLPQIETVISFLRKGVGIHHSGLLPILKELVEILFSKNLIKILFATETFSMGINMPAKSVVFLNLYKPTRMSRRLINNSEFIQMSGRAGRRGFDKRGIVIIAEENLPPTFQFKKLLTGLPPLIESRFKLQFNYVISSAQRHLNHLIDTFKERKRKFRLNLIEKEIAELKNKINFENKNDVYCEYLRSYNSFRTAYSYFLRKNKKQIKFCITENSIIENYKIIEDEKNDLYNFFNTNREFKNNEEVFLSKILYLSNDGKTIFKDFLLNNEADFNNYAILQSNLKQILLFENFEFHKEFLRINFNNLIFEEKIIKFQSILLNEKKAMETEYKNRLNFLKTYKYLSDENQILKKGEISLKIKTINEIYFTELFTESFLKKYSLREILILVSSILDSNENLTISFDLDEIFTEFTTEINLIKDKLLEFDIFDELRINYSTGQAIYYWLENYSLPEVVQKTKISEGNFIRLILRLNEFLEELKEIYQFVEIENFDASFYEITNILNREILYGKSIYLN